MKNKKNKKVQDDPRTRSLGVYCMHILYALVKNTHTLQVIYMTNILQQLKFSIFRQPRNFSCYIHSTSRILMFRTVITGGGIICVSISAFQKSLLKLFLFIQRLWIQTELIHSVSGLNNGNWSITGNVIKKIFNKKFDTKTIPGFC